MTKSKPYFLYNETSTLENFGNYRLGLTQEEVKIYLKDRIKRTNSKLTLTQVINKFYSAMGGSTGAVVENKLLMYRHDVLRFANKIFLNTPTYFD